MQIFKKLDLYTQKNTSFVYFSYIPQSHTSFGALFQIISTQFFSKTYSWK